MEVWKGLRNIVEHGEHYEVSNIGRVRSLDRIAPNGQKVKGRILKVKTHKKGYREVVFTYNKKQKTYKVHRLVALAFIPNPNNKPQVNHKDGDKSNNNVYNLEWATEIENQHHAIEKGLKRSFEGVGNPMSKLTESDVVEIRNLYKTGNYTLKELSDMFGVAFQTISSIVNYKSWKNVR